MVGTTAVGIGDKMTVGKAVPGRIKSGAAYFDARTIRGPILDDCVQDLVIAARHLPEIRRDVFASMAYANGNKWLKGAVARRALE